ncbi:MAG: hypothetical protein M5U31_08350 [Acidimicrobiia bacterium]|nr:hypothetical protein [Acidimicrobiia bacterium]
MGAAPKADIEDLPRITPGILRNVESMCPLRVRFDHSGARSNTGANLRYRVKTHVLAQARVAHAELRVAELSHFEALPSLVPEEGAGFDAAVSAYVDVFADDPARTLDLDEWETIDVERGVRLVAGVDLFVEDASAHAELRFLDLDGWPAPADPLEDPGILFAVARVAEQVRDGPLRLRGANLRDGTLTFDEQIHPEAERDRLDTWLDDRLRVVREIANDGRPRKSMECGRCRYVSRCKAHR